jgi:hypothetical protein
MQSSFHSDLGHLLQLPSLKNLRMDKLGQLLLEFPYELPNIPWTTPSAVSNIETLLLRDVHLPAVAIAHLVYSCKNLYHFECVREDGITVAGHHWCQDIITSSNGMRTLWRFCGQTPGTLVGYMRLEESSPIPV